MKLSTLNTNNNPILSFKNQIINGGFDVWQRGETFGPLSSFASADRWWSWTDGPTHTAQKLSNIQLPNGDNCNAIRLVGDSIYAITQTIEAPIFKSISNKTVSISFWGKCSSNYTCSTGHFRDKEAAEPAFTSNNSVTLTPTWTYYSYSYDVPDLSTRFDHNCIFYLVHGLNYGSVELTIDLAQVQVEISEKATSFEERLLSVEELLCYRYFFKPAGSKFATNYAGASGLNSHVLVNYEFPTVMRVRPTVLYTQYANFNVTNPSTYMFEDGGMIYGTVVNAVANNCGVYNVSFDAEI